MFIGFGNEDDFRGSLKQKKCFTTNGQKIYNFVPIKPTTVVS